MTNEKLFQVRWDSKGFPYIISVDLLERINDVAELTTSPKGVMPKVYVDDCYLCRWTPSGKSVIIDEFDTEEEAEEAWNDYQYEYYINSTEAMSDFWCFDDALAHISDVMGISIECAKSLVHHHDILCDAMAKREAEILMRNYHKALANANGMDTKALRRAYNHAHWPNCQMYGGCGTDDRTLDVIKYYTEDFRKLIDR